MARFLVRCLCLILSLYAHFSLSMADNEEQKVQTAGISTARKLGKHTLPGGSNIEESVPSPAEAPESAEGPGAEVQEAENSRRHHHRGIDKSVAGGGVILGGLATTFLVAIFCYIRATSRKAIEPVSPTTTDSSFGKRKNGEISSSNS